MFDFVDVLSIFFASSAPGGRGKRTFGEEFTWSLAIIIFPFAAGMWVLLTASSTLAHVLPVAFAVVTLVLADLLGVNGALKWISTFICGLFCFAAGMLAMFLTTPFF